MNSYGQQLTAAARYFVLGLLITYVAFPVYWTVQSSFKVGDSLFENPTLFPFDPTLQNYVDLFGTEFMTYFQNSVIVGIGAIVLTTLLATLGGYGLTRADFRGKRNVARSVLFSYMFPPILLALPMYLAFYNLGLLNSYFALMIAHTAISLPFCMWLMWQYFQTIPIAYEESAWINGAGKLRALWSVVIPMARPGIIASSIFTFAITWNDFTFAVVIMSQEGKRTLPVGVQSFVEQTAVHWGLIVSAAALIMLPAFLLVFFLQKYLLYGFSVTEAE